MSKKKTRRSGKPVGRGGGSHVVATPLTWAALIKKVYEFDFLKCPKCGGQMRIISFIEAKDQMDVIEKLLKHCKLWNVFTAFSDNFPDTFISFIHLYELRWINYAFCLGSLDLSTASGYLPSSMKIKIPISQLSRNFQVFDPLDFLAEVTQHIPNTGEHTIRYYGWYSNKSRGMRAKSA